MKLNKISIKNILAVKSAEIETEKPIIFVAGNNASGKTCIADAVSMALTGGLCRVKLKQEAPWLINGNEDGMAEVTIGDSYFYHRILKNGTVKGQGIDPAPALPYVLTASRFAASKSDEIRKLVLNISGTKITSEKVKERMLAKGIDGQMADHVIPLLRAGFPDAQAEAQTKARDEKVLWKGVTGEAYGDKKAPEWKAKAEGDLTQMQNAVMEKEQLLATINVEYDQVTQQYGAMDAEKSKSDARASEIATLQEEAAKIPRIQKKLEFDLQQAKDTEALIENTRRLASNITSDDTVCHCPSCGTEVIFLGRDKKLIEHGDMSGDEDAAANLTTFENSLNIILNSIENDKRDLANSEKAKAQLDAINSTTSQIDDAAFLAITAKRDELKSQKKSLEDEIKSLSEQVKALMEADQKTAKALEHHTQVMKWLKVADALAPDGIPGEFLKEAIAPFLKRLEFTADITGWPPVTLDSDMNVMVEGRPYCLSSKSFQWRADVLLAEAVSHVSGLKLFIIDGMDILESSSRGSVFIFLEELAIRNEIDTCIINGTLQKQHAENVAKSFNNTQVHWMQDGVLERVEAQEEAVA
ncbi:AAA family ATPase [Nitrosomonas sp. Nm58]|uniref:AAA family ATPase n=1 Tax=Nitrosomonas sp. Nm58 TaxID=200126 RepID=UPI00089B7099|nr:AAA family ATPase [Nitrosomonas sp. Nm58]SDY37576.1 AAA ATPase domain-containing protein [Nitrosomonas sp. Nm58]